MVINKRDGKFMYNINKILAILPHRYPFVFVDKILSLEKDKVYGIKNLAYNEPYFQGHIPSKPVFPGVYMIEALAQLGGVILYSSNKQDIFYLAKVEKTRFKKVLVPGDQLHLYIEMTRSRSNIFQFSGRIEVDGALAMDTEICLALER